MKIYLATSWRNPYYGELRAELIRLGHEVYDFRDPESHFQWSSINPNYAQWTFEDFRRALKHPQTYRGFNRDKDALDWCDVCIGLMPAGNDMHLELGYATGKGKTTILYFPWPISYDWKIGLMYKFCKHMVLGWEELTKALARASHRE